MHTQTLYKRSELSVKQEQTLKTPKVITHCIGFTSVFSLIGLENSHLSFDQSDAKTKINHDLFSHIFWIYYGLRVIFPLFETRCRVLLTWVSLNQNTLITAPKGTRESFTRSQREEEIKQLKGRYFGPFPRFLATCQSAETRWWHLIGWKSGKRFFEPITEHVIARPMLFGITFDATENCV